MWSERAVMFWREYTGMGLIAIWFLLSAVYLFLREEKKPVRILFLYTPFVLLFLFFNPLFSRLVEIFVGEEIYYRFLWLLPMTVTIAYACASVCGGFRGRKRGLLVVAAVLVLAVSGNCIYGNAFFSRAENWYHVPDRVVHICDAIEIPGREVTAVFPLEMIQYVRQYSPLVCMPYGREILVEKWDEWFSKSDLYYEMEAKEPDAGILGAAARDGKCVYIVIPGWKQVQGELEDQGYYLFDEIDGYKIYKDIYFEPGF